MTVLLGSNELKTPLLGATTLKQIRAGDKKVFPKGFTPGPNTKFYFPFKEDILDKSGNGVTTSLGGSITYTNPGANFSETLTINYTGTPNSRTYAGFFKANSTSAFGTMGKQASITSSGYYGRDSYLNSDGTNNCRVEMLKYQYSNVWKSAYSNIGSNNRHFFALVCDNNTTGRLYIDGVLKDTRNISGRTKYSGTISLGTLTAGDIFMEDKARTQTELVEYFNNLKSLYGIS